jgi:CDP-6-deoxy-D-xylo-4-hexulose-3-dehydrase
MPKSPEQLRNEILALVKDYYEAYHQPVAFEPGVTPVKYAGRVYDHKEMVNLVSASLDYWLTAGPYCQQFESSLANFFRAKDSLLVNAGSSANLVMVSTLCSKELASLLKPGDLSPLRPGDEVITPAVTFPTTLAPIIQNQLLPVFVDCELGTYNIQPELIEPAISSKTKAIFVPHTLGNPCDMDTIMKLADKYKLWVLEDGCDALGATFNGQLVGTFGAMSSLSFYPAHHITLGEGGAVIVNHPRLQKTAQSIRDWGRDCWCDPGISNTCGKRFDWQLGALPCGYDHKYIYSNIGYNLKATDLQAAIGVAQLDKIDFIVKRRRQNFHMLLQGLQSLQPYLILPKSDPRSNPSPFGFPVTTRDGISCRQLIHFLEEAKIETRQLFGGNILRQPAFMNIEQRTFGTLVNSDKIMSDSFFVGVYPNLTEAMVEYVIEKFFEFFKKKAP